MEIMEFNAHFTQQQGYGTVAIAIIIILFLIWKHYRKRYNQLYSEEKHELQMRQIHDRVKQNNADSTLAENNVLSLKK